MLYLYGYVALYTCYTSIEVLEYPPIFKNPTVVLATSKDATVPQKGALFDLLKAASTNDKLSKTTYNEN